MGRPVTITLEVAKQEFIDRNLIPLFDEYNYKDKLLAKTLEGYLVIISLNSLKKGVIPDIFNKSNPFTIQNIKLWLKINNKPFELLSKEYNGSSKKLNWKCLKEDCGEEFEMSWNCILQNQGCSFCSGKQAGLSNCLATKNPELAKEWNQTLNGNLTPYNVTCGSHKRIYWKCKECGHEWRSTIDNRNKGRGCPQCAESKGEKQISEYLKRNDFSYTPQKEFDRLLGLGSKNLSYDFYIPKLNLLIEYQGEQHEHYCKGFHKSKKDFERQVEHDRRKKEYAQNNNVKLLEIWYYDFDNIEEILEKELKY